MRPLSLCVFFGKVLGEKEIAFGTIVAAVASGNRKDIGRRHKKNANNLCTFIEVPSENFLLALPLMLIAVSRLLSIFIYLVWLSSV
jgi:hypothetical protein